MTTRRTTLLAAILLAIGTGWVTLLYINSVKNAGGVAGEMRTVVVAAADIPARTTITAAMVKTVQRSASGLEPDAISDPARAVGQISLITIPADASLTASKIGSNAVTGLPVRLAVGKRAVSISVDKVKGISGLLQPGDRVDVIAVPPRAQSQPEPASTILRGIRVLAVGDSLETTSATPSPQEETSTTVTLEVSPSQADLLAMADQDTVLRLALRSPREALHSQPTEAIHFADVAEAVQPVAQTAPAPAPPAVLPAAAPAVRPHAPPGANAVMFIDGDRVSYGYSNSAPQSTDAQP